MGLYTFDELEDSPRNSLAAKPFFTQISGSEKERLEWLTTVIETLRHQARRRITNQRCNLAAYRGLNWGQISTRNNITRDRLGLPLNKTERFKVNFLHNYTETKVSQMARIKPAVQILPNSNEFKDKNAAKAVKSLVDHIFYENNVDLLVQQVHRYKKIFGEAFLFIEWDQEKGPVEDGYMEGMTLLDEQGQPMVNEEGDPVIIPRAPRMGDICFTLEAPWRVFLQRKQKMEEVEYAFRLKTIPVDELKAMYPEKASEIEPSNNASVFDIDEFMDKRIEEEVLVWEFYHKDTKFVPGGYFCKFTDACILEEGDLPYTHGGLPFERLTDIDLPETLDGLSVYDIVLPLQNMHDNLTTLIAKNIWLTAHPKWMMPQGAAKVESLGNEATVVQFQGPMAPQLVTVNSNTKEVYEFRDILKNEFGEIFGVHPVSTGNPPTGITAAVALQFLNEQESERATSEIAKHNLFIERVARKVIAVAGDNYDYEDSRLLKILGQDQEYMLKYFDQANLNKSYDVKVDLSTALPDSKAGRTERIFQAMQYNREMLPPERWAELLDLGAVDKMNSLITESIKTAESENEDIIEGIPVADPEAWEEHLQHWHAHVKRMQSRSFKEEVPPEIRAELIAHVTAHEYLMVEKAKVNPRLSAELAQLSQFPLFYVDPSFQAQSVVQQEAVVQGQANRGEPINQQIPDLTNPQLGGDSNE